MLMTLLSVIFLKDILLLLKTDETIIKDSLLYGYIIFGGPATTIAYNLCASILRALGDSKTPLVSIIASSVINIVLNSVTVFAMGIGVAALLLNGAAYAVILKRKPKEARAQNV